MKAVIHAAGLRTRFLPATKWNIAQELGSQTLKNRSSILYVMRVIAIIPAYNEEETIGDVIKETKKYVDDVIVINDGSTDRTEDVAKKNYSRSWLTYGEKYCGDWRSRFYRKSFSW